MDMIEKDFLDLLQKHRVRLTLETFEDEYGEHQAIGLRSFNNGGAIYFPDYIEIDNGYHGHGR